MPKETHDLATLSEPDVRAIVRLLGEVAAIQGDHAEKKRYLMDGLCTLIDAQFWAWTLAAQFEPGKPPVYIGATMGGFGEKSLAKYLAAVEAPVTHRLSIDPIKELHDRKCHLTRTLDQVSQKKYGHWRDSDDPGATLWKDADIGSVIVSYRPINQQYVSGVGIYRNFSAPPFSDRDGRRIGRARSPSSPPASASSWSSSFRVAVASRSPRIWESPRIPSPATSRRSTATSRYSPTPSFSASFIKATAGNGEGGRETWGWGLRVLKGVGCLRNGESNYPCQTLHQRQGEAFRILTSTWDSGLRREICFQAFWTHSSACFRQASISSFPKDSIQGRILARKEGAAYNVVVVRVMQLFHS